jgi:2,3-dihydroxyphenylpropionate 1,2-dioxygenase
MGAAIMTRVALACASHTPLLMREELADAETVKTVQASFDQLGRFVKDFAPERIIQFSPDHFHGFHYDLMPSFCVGAAATSYGDYGTASGPLAVDEEYAVAVLDAVRESDIDAALSYDMVVDHGFVQVWEIMFRHFSDLPITPIFVNAIGFPLPKYRRARRLGEAVGRFAAQSGERILFVASGGLSHDPIVPRMSGASPELRDRLTGRVPLTREKQAERERAVHAAGVAALAGEGSCRPLNPQWDNAFLDMICASDWSATDALTAESVDQAAGAGGNEVLAWVAAAAAAAAAGGGYQVVQRDYRPIPGWIAGMAVLAAQGLNDGS